MTDNLGKTFYNDISVKDVWNNFKIKNKSWIWVRFIFLGLFGLFFKMIVRANRAQREPDTGKIIPKYAIMIWSTVILILGILIVVALLSLKVANNESEKT